jgi:Family of unknown function (DUF6428)
MLVSELNQLLRSAPKARMQFLLPSGVPVPPHFHVTEVGRVEKSFIDCGGTIRSSLACVLQLWTADDVEHRLQCDKLSKIMSLAEPILRSSDLPVEIEYGTDVVSTYSVSHCVSAFGTLQLHLVGKQTQCLAQDKCLPGNATGCC